MGYPEHWLLAFGGHQGEISEQWTCGIRMGEYGVPPGVGVDPEDYLTTVAVPALAAWFGRANSLIASVARLSWAKFNRINSLGHYDDPAITHEYLWTTPVPGGASTPLHPLQVAMVLSWRTDAAERGLASKGRIYSPRPAATLDALGDLSQGGREAAAGSAALLLNTLDVGVDSGVMRPSIVSPGSGWPEETDNPGAMNQINRVVVDSSLDIQRRRSKSQTKESSFSVVAY